jgi:nucleoid-associated protein YgaU
MTMAAGWLNPASAYPQDSAEEVLRPESGLYYTVEKGDTLWDISQHFYDSPWVWPDLWQKKRLYCQPSLDLSGKPYSYF